ncbi:hypothetical protein H5410_028495 [Solanum commersonii]|uniref:Uncharacterized protein n=1 Tax=Solanum commersonii TaxID=4109 RepID=A0A9J5Z241_SOLCO|nr:hypothetical protein H5410_028495 [Solanum commersonii]
MLCKAQSIQPIPEANGTVQVGSKAVNSFLWASFPPQLREEFHCHEVNTCLHRFKILFPSVFSPFSLLYREMAAWGVDFTSSATVFTSSQGDEIFAWLLRRHGRKNETHSFLFSILYGGTWPVLSFQSFSLACTRDSMFERQSILVQ